MRITAVPAINSAKTAFSLTYWNDGVKNAADPIFAKLASSKVKNIKKTVAAPDKKGFMDIIKNLYV